MTSGGKIARPEGRCGSLTFRERGPDQRVPGGDIVNEHLRRPPLPGRGPGTLTQMIRGIIRSIKAFLSPRSRHRGKIFLISDLHLNHAKIIFHCNAPYTNNKGETVNCDGNETATINFSGKTATYTNVFTGTTGGGVQLRIKSIEIVYAK